MNKETKATLIALLEKNQARLQAYGVARLGLFGSFVREQQKQESDVDLLVEFKPGQKTFHNFMYLGMLLEDILGREVDLLTPESLSPYIGPHILREVEYVSFSH